MSQDRVCRVAEGNLDTQIVVLLLQSRYAAVRAFSTFTIANLLIDTDADLCRNTFLLSWQM